MPMEGADTVVAGDTEVVDILEDSLGVEDLPADFLVVIEDLAAEDSVNIHHSAARGALVEEDIEAVRVQDIEAVRVQHIEAVRVADIMAVMCRDITMEDTTTQEDITEAIIDTTIEAMPHTEQPLDFSLVG
jgi:hypothetical protein